MPYYNRDPKRDPNFDNHPAGIGGLGCCSLARGGALVVENYEQDGGSAVFENCSANGTKRDEDANKSHSTASYILVYWSILCSL